jgi:hypothetical protein
VETHESEGFASCGQRVQETAAKVLAVHKLDKPRSSSERVDGASRPLALVFAFDWSSCGGQLDSLAASDVCVADESNGTISL